MTEQTARTAGAGLHSELEDFAQQIADQVQSFLLALQAIARGEATGGHAVSLLLLEVSQVLLAGARLGVQTDFETVETYEPDAGPDPDLDQMRLRLAVLLEGVDAYTEVFDPYVDPPELAPSLLSDDLTSIATSLAHGLRHYKAGRVDEALPTSRRGATRPAAPCAPCRRWSPTTGSTRSSRASRTRWRPPTRCSTPQILDPAPPGRA